MCKELGFAINPEKVTEPATTINFLWIDIDSVAMEARIDSTHLSETISLPEDIVGHQSATKWSILTLTGKLHFMCHIWRPDRVFFHHMIEISVKAPHLHHRIQLNQEFCRDVDWWLHYLPIWNGVSLLYKFHWLHQCGMSPFNWCQWCGLWLLPPETLVSGWVPGGLLPGWAYKHQLERAVCHHHDHNYQGGSV